MLQGINSEAITILTRIQVQSEEQVKALEQNHPENDSLQMQHAQAENVLSNSTEEEEASHQPYVRKEKKLGRNDPCWCGSGKKYKHCHGKLK